MILLDGGISNKNKNFIKIDFFSYPSFRKRFMKVLLDMLENDIGKDNLENLKIKFILITKRDSMFSLLLLSLNLTLNLSNMFVDT